MLCNSKAPSLDFLPAGSLHHLRLNLLKHHGSHNQDITGNGIPWNNGLYPNNIYLNIDTYDPPCHGMAGPILCRREFRGHDVFYLYNDYISFNTGPVDPSFFTRSCKKKIVRRLPAVTMLAICMIIAITIAMSRDQILAVGLALLGAVICHNSIGFLLGYGCSRVGGLQKRDARTVAIEVGNQNGGMATGLAFDVLKSAQAALGSAVFGPCSAISGTALASWWRQHPKQSPAPLPVPLKQGEQMVTL